MKRSILFLGLVSFLGLSSFADEINRANIREQFKNNEAIIYTINIRSFAAVDKDDNGIIEVKKGDINGSFLNAKAQLEQLKNDGINTIYLLPITPVGKLKALGTAGSLYAMDSFDKINPQLDDLSNEKTVFEEAKEFVDEAHRLGMNVIVDLPSCGSYDLSLKKPHWFILNKNKEAVIPADWTDVRLFKEFNQDKTLNEDTLNNFKSFVDMVQNLGIDGIRADVAAIKSHNFWKKIISYAREKNEKFLFLAEASLEWDNPAPRYVSHYTSVNELLSAGFDAYYGSWSDFKNIKTKKEFDKKINGNLKNLKKNKGKSIISSFATHDQQAPILRGENYWNMVLWLSVTLPNNLYFLDGFSTGDDFTYSYENKKAQNSLTDDEYYFVHSGMFDIFNLNSKPIGKHLNFKDDYLKAIDFKDRHNDLISKGKFKLLKTGNEKVFAYSITNFDRELIVIGSLDDKNNQKAKVKSKYLNKDNVFNLTNTKSYPSFDNDFVNVTLEPLELQVYMFSLASFRAM